MQCQQLEHKVEQKIEYKVQSQSLFITWLINFYQAFLNRWFYDQDLKVWQKIDRQGNTYWKVYNPVTYQTMYFNCEEEIRIWIDQSYYRQILGNS